MTQKISFDSVRAAQKIAQNAMAQLVEIIRPGMTESDIAAQARVLMDKLGAESYWYHDVAGFVLVGERTGLSISGRHYKPSDIAVNDNDMITIDLSPVVAGGWGDYARSVFVAGGKASLVPQKSSAHVEPMALLDALHDLIVRTAKPEMTTHALWELMTGKITEAGYQNADFRGNLGHSVEAALDDRRYIEKDGTLTLAELGPFTFEPHVMPASGGHGYKREDIYYFEGAKLHAL